MKWSTVVLGGLCSLVVLVALAVSAASGADVSGVSVAIAPQTLLIDADQGGSVVAHVTIKYGLVAAGSVTLEGVAATGTKPDCRGELVAYFDEATIKALVSPPSATLTLTGSTVDGDVFTCTDTVRVTACRGR